MQERPLILRIIGEPVGQGRPRFARIGKRTIAYDPERSREQKAFIRFVAEEATKDINWIVDDVSCYSIVISSYFGIAKNKSKKFRTAALAGDIRPIKKCDVDNLAKLIMDALSGVAYKDDKQVVDLHCYKYYSEEPYTVIEVSKMRNDNV